MKRLVSLALLLCLAYATAAPTLAVEGPMTNKDVVGMVNARLSDTTITTAIRASQPAFDISADALIKLKSAGVSDAIIQTILDVQAGTGSPAKPSGGDSGGQAVAGANAAGTMNPEEVILIDGSNRTGMKYLSPRSRTAMRGMGFGGMAQYAVLPGTAAGLRIKDAQPTFIVAVPSNAQPESYYTLANFAVRNNGTREVAVNSGYYGTYSSGINRDRVVACNSEKDPDQSQAIPGYVIYRVKPASSLSGGEYAFILHSSQFKVTGFFMNGMDSYFDFGVDN